jgi:putative ABC transport system permease protein
MALWRQITRGLRRLINQSAADQDVADEVQHYLDQAVAAHAARGLSKEEALRAARLELGGVAIVQEQVRGYGWENVVETLLADLRYAARRLRAEPGFTAVTVLTIALGVGTTTAIVGAVKPILFEPLPYPDVSRLAMILEIRPDGARNDGTFGMYRELRDRSRSFLEIAVLRPWQTTITGRDQPERLNGQRVSARYFHVLGVRPVLGRDFQESEDRLNGPNVVILSDRLWRRRFGGDTAVVGRPITLDENLYTVIGVMPEHFENVLAPSADVWTPLQYDMSQGRAWGHHLRTVGRFRPEVGIAQATEDLNSVGQAVLKEQRPASYGRTVKFVVTPLHDEVTGNVKPALIAVLGAVTLLLLIACVNVTNLLLARGVRRRSEFAMRAALGAGGRRLVRQLLTESTLLSLIGGLVGMAFASAGVRALVALSPEGLPRADAIRVDAALFAIGFVIAALVGQLFGVIPALQAARSDPRRDLREGSGRGATGHRRTRGALVVAEVALALMLLVSAGLLLRSLQRLFAVEPGFDSSGLLTMQVHTSGQRFDTETTIGFFAEALDAVRNVPGVTAAALTSQLPLSGDFDLYGVRFDPRPPDDPGEISGTFRYAVSPGYIETMRIPLKRGRVLDERDRSGAPRVALVSESLVRRRMAGVDPIGQRLQIGDGPLYTVVGVVGDVKQLSLARRQSEAVYVTASQWRSHDNAMSLVIRANGEVTQFADAVRQAVWTVDRNQPVVRIATMDDLQAHSAAERRFVLIVLATFALAALVLAAAGIYGVLSGNVAERTHEIGIRAALGAPRTSILALVIRQGLTLTAFGLALGLAGAAAASQGMTTMLFGVSRLDPVTYAGVVVLLGCVSMVACSVPALRAVRVDPARTLRAE